MSLQGPGCVKTCASRECAELFSPLSPSTVTASAILFLFNVIETKFLGASSTSEFSHSLDPKPTFPQTDHRDAPPSGSGAWCWTNLFGFALPVARATGLSESAIVGARCLDVVRAGAAHQMEFALRYRLECAGAFGGDLGSAFKGVIGNVAVVMMVGDVTLGRDISADDLILRNLG